MSITSLQGYLVQTVAGHPKLTLWEGKSNGAKNLASLALNGFSGMSGVFKATNHKHCPSPTVPAAAASLSCQISIVE